MTLAALLCLLVVGEVRAQDSGNVVIGTEVTFDWTAASGPVASYVVEVMRNNTPPFKAEQIVDLSRTATISGVDGERIEVRVAARDASDNQGPYSPRSVPVYFSVPPPLTAPGQPVCRCAEPSE